MIYQYKCQLENCQHQFEINQSIKDDKLTICPVCGKESLEKVLSAPTVIYKGNNWFNKGGY